MRDMRAAGRRLAAWALGVLSLWAVLAAGVPAATASPEDTCEPAWRSWGGVPGVSVGVTAVTTWDPDGAGPMTAQVVAGGSFQTAGGEPIFGIARWDGSRWQSMDTRSGTGIWHLLDWDPDGAGSALAELVAAGTIVFSGGSTPLPIARWGGSVWHGFGAGAYDFGAIVSWDQDGTGPQTTNLVAMARFSSANGERRVARWSGSGWDMLGTGPMDAVVRSFAVWDPDGGGPASSELIAGGRFTIIDGIGANYIARWDGSRWRPMDLGFNLWVNAVTLWDPDGSGPQHHQLVAGGRFTSALARPVNRVARWDGSRWLPLGSGLDGDVECLTTWDPDGPGPQSSRLIAGGAFTTAGGMPVRGIAQWNGSGWEPLGAGVAGNVIACTTWDPDGAGPQPSEVVAAGQFTVAGERRVNGIARWNGRSWQPFGGGMSEGSGAITVWDPDDAGPETPRLVAGSTSTTIAQGQTLIHRIDPWETPTWSVLGITPFGHSVMASCVWDPDDSGPLPSELVVGGDFYSLNGVTLNGIGLWNGARWLSFGSGMASGSWRFPPALRALTTWDPDGTGPTPRELVAGGQFVSAGGVAARNIARWDGTQWFPLGQGPGTTVEALHVWDPDGPGPLPERLVVGGITSAPAPGWFLGRVTLWDGVQWQQLGPDFTGDLEPRVLVFTTWDPDGQGPLPAQLVAGGRFITVGGVTVNGIARWDGTQWLPFGLGMNAQGVFTPSVGALEVWDPDGLGPLPAQLVAGGIFSTAGGLPVSNIARWNGKQWGPLGAGTNDRVRDLATWDPDGPGPQRAQLIATGDFRTAGGLPAGFLAWWGCPLTPPCPGDWDGDGIVDFNDFLAFLNDFNLQIPRADINQDGAIDFNDLLAFLNFFNTPC